MWILTINFKFEIILSSSSCKIIDIPDTFVSKGSLYIRIYYIFMVSAIIRIVSETFHLIFKNYETLAIITKFHVENV